MWGVEDRGTEGKPGKLWGWARILPFLGKLEGQGGLGHVIERERSSLGRGAQEHWVGTRG